MGKVYDEHLKQVKGWLVRQPNIELLYVNYNTMVADPMESLQKVNEFLGGGMDVQVMAGVVDKELYRERK
jgi:predicted methyltransferase